MRSLLSSGVLLVGIGVTACGGRADEDGSSGTDGDATDAPSDVEEDPLGLLVSVPGGSFTMGCVPGRDDTWGGQHLGCDADEEPAHPVTLTHPLQVMEAELTARQWRALMGNDPSWFADCDDCPVDSITWWDALAVANAASVAEGLPACFTLAGCAGSPGKDHVCTGVTVEAPGASPYACEGYRLPTEAEFEYLVRAGGDAGIGDGEPLDDIAWYGGDSGFVSHPVCTLQRNAFGLCDTVGNVYEWTWDWFGPYAEGAVTDPEGASDGDYRVYRGGFWRDDVFALRSSARFASEPGYQNYFLVGVRLVRTEPG